MANIDLLLEAERRGILPDDKAPLLQEARRRGLVGATAKFESTFDEEDDGIAQDIKNVAKSFAFSAPLGLGDEIRDVAAGITAGVISKDLTIGEGIKQARDLTEQEKKQMSEQTPIGTAVGSIGGSILGLAGGAQAIGKGIGSLSKQAPTITKGVKKGAAKVAEALPKTTKALQASAAGGTGAGVIAFGENTGSIGERLEASKDDVAAGAIAGPILMGASNFIGRAFSRKPIVPNSDKIRKEASKLYDFADSKGGVLTPKFTNDFLKEIDKLTPQTSIGKQISGKTAFTQIVNDIKGIKDQPISLRAAQEFDEYLGDAIDNFTDAGRLTKQGKKLFEIQSLFRNMIESADDTALAGGGEGFAALKEARKLWSTSRKLADIERIIQRAELTEQPATSLKAGFRTLLNNPNRLKGFNEEEVKAIRKAAETGVITDTIKTFGSRLIPVIAVSGGGGLTGGAAATASSLAARSAATKLQVSKANKLAEIIANKGVPVARKKVSVSPVKSGGVAGAIVSQKEE